MFRPPICQITADKNGINIVSLGVRKFGDGSENIRIRCRPVNYPIDYSWLSGNVQVGQMEEADMPHLRIVHATRFAICPVYG